MSLTTEKPTTRSVYYLHYDVTSEILKFPGDHETGIDFVHEDEYNDDGTLKSDKYTYDMHKRVLEKELNYKKKDRIHLATGSDETTGVVVDEIRKKSIEEFKKILKSSFRDVCLPNISIVQQQHQQQQQVSKVVDDDDEVGCSTTTPTQLLIQESINEDGYFKWEWNFQGKDLLSNNDKDYFGAARTICSKCLVQCTGSVYVEREEVPTRVDSHVLCYDAKCRIVDYGSICYEDCWDDLEGAEAHADDELAYDYKKGDIIVGYNLQNVDEVNEKAEDVVKKLMDDEIFRNVEHTDSITTIQPTRTNEGLYKWSWNFTARDTEFGDCELQCEGSIHIGQKQSRNPKLPKKQKPKRSAIKASAEHGPRYPMKTNIFDSNGELFINNGR